MTRFSPEEKIAIINRVIKERNSVYSVCKQHQISKVTFYKWLSRYKNGKKNRVVALESRVLKGKKHPRSLTYGEKLSVLRLVHKHPEYSCHKISKLLLIGHHAVQNLLEKEGLGRKQAREELSKRPFWKREDSGRRLAMMDLYKQGWKVGDICRHFKISKPTFAKWRKRYAATGQSLEDRFVSGEKHYNFLPGDKEKQVLELVRTHPELSAHKLHEQLAGVVGHHGVQNVLRRHNLSTYEQRLAYSKLAEKAWKPKWELAKIPQIPLYIWRMLYAPFATIPKFGWLFTRGQLLLILVFILTFYFYHLLASIITSPTGTLVGTFFASVSLTFGLFFLIYSLKYYFSTLLVLRLAQTGGAVQGESRETMDNQGKLGGMQKILSKLGQFLHLPAFAGASARQARINPLLVNLDRVKLGSGEKPFVSIHVAVYNEKKVVERLIRACTSQAWIGGNPSTLRQVFDPEAQTRWAQGSGSTAAKAAFEVVIVDDSTDETTEIVKETLISADWKLIKTDVSSVIASEAKQSKKKIATPLDTLGARNDGGEEGANQEVFVFGKPGAPTVKLIHRASRSGFKGGALREALRVCDPKAAYICVFDADFVPYPDTITQFIKTFQVLAEGQPPINADLKPISADKTESVKSASNQSNQRSNIAAVQGYQWHVLNKSVNWVTRGVRTEYAGSYVIERSCEEIYGGLKQIAGSVYCIRADVLRKFGWGTSITEDFELTLRLYEAGYKVAFTPYIQVPAEAVSTIKRLIRQRMRWAEGASFNVKKMLSRMLFGRWETAPSVIASPSTSLGINSTKQSNSEIATSFDGSTSSPLRIRNDNQGRVWVPSRLTLAEKLEFAYLAPYYLQAFFFVVGTLSWFMAEAVLGSRLPFWTAAFGWSLVFTNLLALPLMNIVGMFLEESDERDYIGILSFIVLSYIVVPFQAYAAVKGFLGKEEGPWFRTPKTGLITDVFGRSGFEKFFGNLLGDQKSAAVTANYSSNEVRSFGGEFSLRSNNILSPEFASAFNPLRADTFGIRPRHIRYVGNLALGVIISLTVLMSIFAPLIPQTKLEAQAQERQFAKLINSVIEKGKDVKVEQEGDGEITQPRFLRYRADDNKSLDYIFHPEPRMRAKYEGKEIELEVVGSDGLGKASSKKSLKQNGAYIYQDIFNDVDLRLWTNAEEMREEFILKKYQDFSSLNYDLLTVDLEIVQYDNEIYFFGEDKGKWLFSLEIPFMFEEKNPEVKNYGLNYELTKTTLGWSLKKVLTEEGKAWLSDPARAFPIILDPTLFNNVIQGSITETEARYGSNQRKLVYSSTAAAWYTVYDDGADVFFEKCAASTCQSSGWTSRTDLDTSDADNRHPDAWIEGNNVWVVWVDNGEDGVEFVPIDTGNSDALGTKCVGPDTGGLAPATYIVSIAVADDGDVFTAFADTSTDTELGVFRVASASLSNCGTPTTNGTNWDTITGNSGLSAGDRPVLVTTGNNLHMIFQDGQLSHSAHDGTNTTTWSTANTQIDTNSDTDYSVATDGTDVWVLQANGTAGASLWKCSACPISSPTWTNAADPWSGQSAVSYVAITYISGSNQIIAFEMQGTAGSDEKVYAMTSDADTISWVSSQTLGFTSNSLDHLSSLMVVPSADEVAVVALDAAASELEFSTVPENLLFLLAAVPFLPKVLKRLRKRRWLTKILISNIIEKRELISMRLEMR